MWDDNDPDYQGNENDLMEVDPIQEEINEEDDMNEEDNESPTEWIETTDNQEFELTVSLEFEETDKSEPFNEMSTKVPTSLDGKETDEYEHWNDIQTEVVVSSIKKPADISQQSSQTTTIMPISSNGKRTDHVPDQNHRSTNGIPILPYKKPPQRNEDMTNTSTQIYKTSLVRAIASIVKDSNSSLRRLDRLRIRWKKDQQNNVKEEEFKAELAKVLTTLLKEHANLKETYSRWDKNFYFKHNKESPIDDLQKNHAVYEVYKKMKKAETLLQHCQVSLQN